MIFAFQFISECTVIIIIMLLLWHVGEQFFYICLVLVVWQCTANQTRTFATDVLLYFLSPGIYTV
jgi:hypothetical protein